MLNTLKTGLDARALLKRVKAGGSVQDVVKDVVGTVYKDMSDDESDAISKIVDVVQSHNLSDSDLLDHVHTTMTVMDIAGEHLIDSMVVDPAKSKVKRSQPKLDSERSSWF